MSASWGTLKGYPAKMVVTLHGRDYTAATQKTIVAKLQAAIDAKGIDAVVKGVRGATYSYAAADIHARDFDSLDAAMEAAISTGLVEEGEYDSQTGKYTGRPATDHPKYMRGAFDYLRHYPEEGSRGGWKAGARAKYVSEAVELTEARLRQIIRQEVAGLRRR